MRGIPVNPHVSLLAIFNFGFIDLHYLNWCLISVDDFYRVSGSEKTLVGIIDETGEIILKGL